MQTKYDHRQIEKKWQEKWAEEGLNKTVEDLSKPKFYILDMFPYPSGAGLHVGHPKGYIATDIYARMMKMKGMSVLHPMGWDAFGLPAENHALATGEPPAVATAKNIATFKKQLEMLGLSYDWDREINTTDPGFYKWTQWCFLKMWSSYYDLEKGKAEPIEKLIEQKFGAGQSYYDLSEAEKAEIDEERLAFESWAPINWCPTCKTGLANEDLEGGRCERCDSLVERRPMRQWVLRITKYADRMLKDLGELEEWEEFIKTMQVNWIGRSEGAEVKFTIEFDEEIEGSWEETEKCAVESLREITVFTTRIDTLFGCTYVVVAPEHRLATEIGSKTANAVEVEKYVVGAKNKSELERTDLAKEKTGVPMRGVWAVNPVNGERVPVWVADYVLGDYGTGAVMAVPAHDERDFEFAKQYKLGINEVIAPVGKKGKGENADDQLPYTKDGILVNSADFSGLNSKEAREEITRKLSIENKAGARVNYKIKDWVFSRQRYWGEPIPMIHCEKCGVVAVPENELPVKLPEVEKYEPTGTGESPLAGIEDWVKVKCPQCGGEGRRETNTMPQWAGSSWYYLRYCDPHNDQELITNGKEKYWNPVDFYVGGAEHATRHLIYARFWHKFLYDLGVVSCIEPFTRLQHVGLIMAEDGRKMSKRWGNVINPDEVVERYGADAMRVYEMFMAPFGQASAWNMQGVSGVRKFLEKVWELREKVEKVTTELKTEPTYKLLLEQTIKKVTRDIEEFKLNTAVSAMMILVNKMSESSEISRHDYEKFLQILAPFAPHLTEEIWLELGNKASIFLSAWPKADEETIASAEVKIMVQVNGKLRGEIVVDPSEAENQEFVLDLARKEMVGMKKIIDEKQIIKEIYVLGKIVNFVVKT